MAIKSTGSISSLDDNKKKIVYLDISCELQNVPFDTSTAISLTKMRKSLYNSNRRTILKVLNLNKKQDVKAVLLKMGITNTNVQKTAARIYEACKDQNFQMDLDHPQVSFMSVYQACKVEKVKAVKKNFIAASNLNLTQWTKLEKSWDKWASLIGKADKENMKCQLITEVAAAQSAKEGGQKLKRKHEEPAEIENYDVWAKRTLEKAYAELKAMKA